MRDVLSCDTAVAVGSATFDGSVIFAKNSDRPANESQPLRHVPRRRHPAGARLRTQYLEIGQVEETWELIGSRPYWLWGFEIGVNEWGVAIGNEAVLSREGYEQPAGLLGMDLIRLGLERAQSADQAVEVIGALTERYGQGGSCEAPGLPFRTYHNSYIVADPGGAWVLETAGRRWFARRVRDRASISNLFTLDEADSASPGAREHARARGWASEPFSFATAYQDPEADLRPRACRLDRSRALLTGHDRPIRVEDMLALLRDHDGHGGIPRGEQELPSICMHVRPGAAGETAAAMVAHLRPERPRELRTTIWTAFGSPCLSVFRPVYPFAVGLPAELDRGGAGYDSASPWWAFERLQRIVARAPDLAPIARARLGELEGRLRAEADATEAEAERRLAAGDRAGALGALRGLVDASTAQAVELAIRLADQLEPGGRRAAIPAMVEAWRRLNAEVGLLSTEDAGVHAPA
jgi:dipeptidase